jgi:hypothetical protein
MGPEPIMGLMSWLGIGIACWLLVRLIRAKHTVLVAAIILVSAAFAWWCSQGQVGSKIVFIFFMFFGIAAVPLSAVAWVVTRLLGSRGNSVKS